MAPEGESDEDDHGCNACKSRVPSGRLRFKSNRTSRRRRSVQGGRAKDEHYVRRACSKRKRMPSRRSRAGMGPRPAVVGIPLRYPERQRHVTGIFDSWRGSRGIKTPSSTRRLDPHFRSSAGRARRGNYGIVMPTSIKSTRFLSMCMFGGAAPIVKFWLRRPDI